MKGDGLGPFVEKALRSVASATIAKPLKPFAKRDLAEITRYRTLAEERDGLTLEEANHLIRDFLTAPDPRMVSRIGSTELRALYKFRYRSTRSLSERVYAMVSAWEAPVWSPWEHRNLRSQTGFFPVSRQNVADFYELMVASLREIDLLGSWVPGEDAFRKELSSCQVTPKENLEPFFATNPWTSGLAGKKVLVVHPFSESISRQFVERRTRLFEDERMLPKFDLTVLPAVQTLGSNRAGFASWFDALDFMFEKVLSHPSDVVIVGAGAYGLPLSAMLKRAGRTVIHLGGPTQLLFGIRGRRWDEIPAYSNLANEHWIRPTPNETPPGAKQVDHGVYW